MAKTPKADSKAAPSSFRTVPVRQRSLWESYAVLPAKTRLRISLALTAFAAAGIYFSNKLEEKLPPTEEEKARLPGHGRPAAQS